MSIKDQLRALKPRGGRVKIQHKYPNRIQREYEAELRKILARLERDISEMVKPAIAEEVRTDSLSDIMRMIADLVQRTLSGDAISRRVAAEVARSNDEQISKAVARAIGVNVVMPGSQISDRMEAWVIENTSLITNMQRDYVQRVQNAVSGGFRRGQTYGDMAKEINKATGISMRRAKLIARDQIGTLNAQVTEQRDKELGIDSYTWRNAGDRRVRGNPSGLYPKSRYDHWEREGRVYRYDDPPPDGNPGEAIQCFPGDTLVNGFPFLEKLYRRRYAGELTEIVCDDGVILSATPNHPIQTSNGFAAIQSINVGDYVVGRGGQAFGVVDNHTQSLIPTFKQVFEAMLGAGVMSAVSAGVGGQFHGDGADSEVDIISTDCFLSRELYTATIEKLCKLGFTNSDMVSAWAFLSSECGLDVYGIASSASDNGLMRAGNLSLSLIFSHLAPLEFLCFALASNCDSGLKQPSSDGLPADPEFFRNSVFAFAILVHGQKAIDAKAEAVWRGAPSAFAGVYASSREAASNYVSTEANSSAYFPESKSGMVKLKRVIEVRRREHFGHVYNLQTVSGYYTANGIDCSNCRCFAEAVIDF